MLCAMQAMAKKKVVNTTINYQINPLGIDERPMLSWQLLATDGERNVMQTAYQIVVSAEDGKRVYDTGKVFDGHSMQIPLNFELKPSARYFYKTRIWGNKGRASKFSDEAWFETGLIVGGADKTAASAWDGAQWIGSRRVLLSPLRSSYVIDYDAEDNSEFVFGKRDENNYNTVSIHDGIMTMSHSDKNIVDAQEDVSKFLNKGTNHVRLNVFASQYCRTYRLDVSVNDSLVKNTHPKVADHPLTLRERLTAGRKATFEIDPSNGDETYIYSRLYDFKGGSGVSHIRITSPAWGTLLYSDDEDVVAKGAPTLKKEFAIGKRVAKARLYVTARGIFECYINGKRVGNDLLAPGWSGYRHRISYCTYDVTSLLHEGNNNIGAILGNGWWCGFNGYQTDWQDQYGASPSMMAKLLVTFFDGSTMSIVSDGSWLCCDNGPVGDNSLQNGETYDATREMTEWNHVKVFAAPADSIRLQAYVGEPVHVADTLRARRMTIPEPIHSAPKSFIYDFGQNMVGIPHIIVHGKRGQKITLRYAEMLWPEEIPSNPVPPYTREMYVKNKGQLYTDNYRSALSTDVYICSGGEEVIEPRFTSHGFRYIQIEGLDTPPDLQNVSALVTNSLTKQTCGYETSDPLLNRLFQNILWGQRGNFLAVPIDCPQRDERLGYTGDGQIFALSATFNYNVAPFMHRWLYSVRDDQLPDGNVPNYAPNVGMPPKGGLEGGSMGWSDAAVIVPWHLYEQYADKEILRQSYGSMKRYMDFLELKSVGGLLPAGGLGDWLAFEQSNDQITNTAYYAYDALLMGKIANALGLADDATHYQNLHERIKRAFNSTFVDKDGRTFTPKGYKKGLFFPKTFDKDSFEDTQTSYVLPLKAQIFDNPQIAARHLAEAVRHNDGHLSTGFIGTPYLAPMLSDNGEDSTAYGLVLTRTYPSWLYPVTQGATTIWERWNSYTKDNGFGPVRMNSFNHYSYGAIEEWLIQYSLGIKADPDEPGYKHFFIEPHIDRRMNFVNGYLDTMYGRISCKWEINGNSVNYNIEVPTNTTATLTIGRKTMSLGSGKYKFEAPL